MLLTSQDAAAAAAAALLRGVATMVALLVGHSQQPERRGDVWLLVLVLACALSGLGDLALHLHTPALRRWLDAPATAALLLPGPALWLYATAILDTTKPPAAGAWRAAAPHLLPFALALTLLGSDVPETAGAAAAALQTHRSTAELWGLVPIALQMLGYGLALGRRLSRWHHQLRQHYSDLSRRSLRWLWLLFGLFTAVLVAWVLTWPLPVAWSNVATNLLMAAVLALVGLRGPRQVPAAASALAADDVRALAQDPSRNSMDRAGPGVAHSAATAESVLQPSPASSEAPPVPYQKAALTPAQVLAIEAGLRQAMECDKRYLESDLTLAQLAQALAVSPHQLSQFLSQHLRLSFYDYVNGLRIDAVKATLARPQSARRSLLEIALECGFGSKSTFNAVFKKSTGLSPTAYRASLAGAGPPDC